MASRIDLRRLADYFAATRNEVAVEVMFLTLSKTQSSNVGHLPRVPHWIAKALKRPHLMLALSRLARFLWIFGGAAIYFLRDYLRFSLARIWTASTIHLPIEGAILGLSSRIHGVVKPTTFPALPQIWLTLPWLERQVLPSAAQEVPLFSMVKHSDFLSAFMDAMTVTYRMQRDRLLSQWVLQTYTAFRWFLVRRVIDRIDGSLVTAEHYDRWAVLVDRSVRERRRSSSCNLRMILVQHGAMGSLTDEEDNTSSSLNLPTRLRQVDELHAYNNSEVSAFRAEVFARPEVSRPLEIHCFKPTLELGGVDISNCPRFLFVGHPLCEAFHVQIFLKLKAWKAIDVLYKPHPMAPMSTSMTEVGWTIIEEANLFPRVDLLVSYPSTLVKEYESVGILACVHTLDAHLGELDSFVDKIQKTIEIRNKS
jgi:hypothetical protein